MLSNRFYTRNLPRCLLQQNKQPTNQECPRHDVPYQNSFALSSHPKITGEANHPVSPFLVGSSARSANAKSPPSGTNSLTGKDRLF